MERESVSSSNIASVGYAEETEVLARLSESDSS